MLICNIYIHACNLSLISFATDFQIHDEARKFSYQTGVKVVVAYGGAPINQQVLIMHLSKQNSFVSYSVFLVLSNLYWHL